MHENGDFKIPTFDGDRSSFQLWKAKLVMMLDARDLGIYATGTTTPLGKQMPFPLTTTEDKNQSKKVKSLICLCLGDDILPSVINLHSAHDVFAELCSQCENNGRGSRVRAWSSFWAIRKGPETIETYISKV